MAAQEEATLFVIGQWIGNQVSDFVGKAIDTLTGSDYGKKLPAVEHLWVSGQGNVIRIEESAGDAQSGTFTISDTGSRSRFHLPPGTGAVIHVTGDDNRFYIPSELLKRVRVVSTGRNNWVLPILANP